jgi:hypothetical protein
MRATPSSRTPVVRCCALVAAVSVWWCGTASAADAVTDWNNFAVSLLTSNGRTPNETGVAGAYMHVAIYDAINAIEGGFESFAVSIPDVPPGASPEAAAAAAAKAILTNLYPSLGPQVAAQYDTVLAQLAASPLSISDGVAVGEASANGLLAARDFPNDGWMANVPYAFQPIGPGVYQQTPGPPPTFQYVGPVTPWEQALLPFSLTSPSQFRVPPPPSLHSDRWEDDFNEVKAYGALTGSLRTPEQSAISVFYGFINAAVQIGINLRRLVGERQLTLQADARFFAQAYVTMADTTISCWHWKYHYNFWRPITAIHEADIDGNDGTEPDPNWAPDIVTPGHPEYPSAHGCTTSAYANAIQEFFGTDHLTITLSGAATRTAPPVLTDRVFDSTDDIVEEIINARVYNGVHYRTSVINGATLGGKVAGWVAKHHFRPIDDDSRERHRRDRDDDEDRKK